MTNDSEKLRSAANHLRLAMQAICELSKAGQEALLEGELEMILCGTQKPTLKDLDGYAMLLVNVGQQLDTEGRVGG